MHAIKREEIKQRLAALKPSNPHYETLRRSYRRILGLECYTPEQVARLTAAIAAPAGGE
jgi:hypothetical protein